MLLYVVAEMFEVDDEMLLDTVGGGCCVEDSYAHIVGCE